MYPLAKKWPANFDLAPRWGTKRPREEFFLRIICPLGFVFVAEGSAGRAGQGLICISLLPLLIIIASKFSHAFPVVRTFADIADIHVQVWSFRASKLIAMMVVAYLAVCIFVRVCASSFADTLWVGAEASFFED